MRKLNIKNFKIRAASNLVIFLVLGGLFFAAFRSGAITAAGREQAYYRGNSDRPYVSLMVNVYEGREYVEKMMAVAEEYDVKLTFFIGGCFAKNQTDLIRSIYERGHELANHGYFHRDPAKLSYKENFDEIVMTERLIEAICNVKTSLFAPPSGSMGKEMFRASKELGYDVIMWSKDTIDWRDKDADLTFTRATKNMKNGDLVLMHPKPHTAEALPKILKFYKDNGFKVVTVSKNIGKTEI
ncbi:MAG: polysaccharide deacetylase family protein [Clostridiales bacterium]|jgi:peptidoglycan/xylan/chitin deacetylase (PgdA/CDA1 family)|nr:polysaccharide deacetylase family protein [Clostridiales bacterium]